MDGRVLWEEMNTKVEVEGPEYERVGKERKERKGRQRKKMMGQTWCQMEAEDEE